MTQRLWAPDWTTIDQGGGKHVRKEMNTDDVYAEFENKAGKIVKVVSNLNGFGDAPNGDKAAHAERVLRAILETYYTKVGNPGTQLHQGDLGQYLGPLQDEFLIQQ